jgi:hypothetical protein
MEDDKIAALKAKFSKVPDLFPQKGLIKIEEGQPLTFFVLCGDYSSKGVWVHPVGVHYVKGKQIVCSEVYSEEEKEPLPCFICERIREMRAGGIPENQVFPYLGPRKYAMNVLVVGEETSRVFLAPTQVGEEIYRTFETALIEKNSNIFDPMASTAWTVTRLKVGGKTQYSVVADPEPQLIVTGDGAKERIERILRSAANLDDRFRLPTLQEQKEAWANR